MNKTMIRALGILTLISLGGTAGPAGKEEVTVQIRLMSFGGFRPSR